MNVLDFLTTYTTKLAQAGVLSARLDCLLALQHVVGREKTWLLANPKHELAKKQLASLKELMNKRLTRTPMAYLLGQQEFYGRTFAVSPDVLIPRPETEALIEAAEKLSATRILDVGTGSGAIAITLALETKAQVTASDVSKKALLVAGQNARTLNADVTFIQSDLLENCKGKFDTIVANLPYVDATWDRSPETNAEPALALFAKANGLELINKLIMQAPKHTTLNGHLLLEADPRQHEVIKTAALKHGFNLIATDGFAVTLQRA